MDEQEISLRELIEILLKNKIMIITITLACVLLAALVSFFVLTPTYQSEAKLIVEDIEAERAAPSGGKNVSIMLSDPEDDIIGEEEVKGIIDYGFNQSQLTIKGYMEQMKSPEIIDSILEDLSLEEKGYTAAGLQSAVNIENIEETNIISIKVEDANPERAAEIANSLATNFSEFISELTTEQAVKSLGYLEKQLLEEKENLKEILVTYKEALAKAGVSEGNIENASIDQQVELELLELEVGHTRNKCKRLLAKTENIKLAESFGSEDGPIVVSSEATANKSPISPNKSLNLAIALVLGLMIGVFIAFAREYWQSTASQD